MPDSPVANPASKDQIAPMIDRRTALLAGFSIAGLPVFGRRAAAQASPQDRADLARIEAYLNGVRSLRARFVQTAPDGNVTQGVALTLDRISMGLLAVARSLSVKEVRLSLVYV